MDNNKKILVIKLGGLSEFTLAFAPFAAIRKVNADAHITLLTEKEYVDFARESGLFNDVITDPVLDWWELPGWLNLIKTLRGNKFTHVYDLETSFRSNMYFRLIGRKKPLWNGDIDWCSHPYNDPDRKKMHIMNRWREQLELTGITRLSRPDISFLKSDISRFGIEGKFALIAAGGRKQEIQLEQIKGKTPPQKLWHEEGFSDVAKWFVANEITPVFIGAEKDKKSINSLLGWISPSIKVINLTGQTSIADIAELARKAEVALGNDNGAMYVASVAGCQSLLLYSKAYKDHGICSPILENVRIISDYDLDNLDSADVIKTLGKMLRLDTYDKLSNSPALEQEKSG